MSAKVRVQIGRAWIEVDANTTKDVVKAIAPYYDLFGESECGQCGAPTIRLEFRVAQGYEFYSLKCSSCGAELNFGQRKDDGRLFPKRGLEDGSFDREHKGWRKWQKPSERRESEDRGSDETF